MRIGLLFPGQGSQSLGMGKDIYNDYETYRNVVKKVNEYTGLNLEEITYNSSEEILHGKLKNKDNLNSLREKLKSVNVKTCNLKPVKKSTQASWDKLDFTFSRLNENGQTRHNEPLFDNIITKFILLWKDNYCAAPSDLCKDMGNFLHSSIMHILSYMYFRYGHPRKLTP